MTPMKGDFQLGLAVRALRSGGIVLHALEGVWGLACDPQDPVAVARLLRLKSRPLEKGLILIGSTPGCFAAELEGLSTAVREALIASWPGAETWVVPNASFPYWVTDLFSPFSPENGGVGCLELLSTGWPLLGLFFS